MAIGRIAQQILVDGLADWVDLPAAASIAHHENRRASEPEIIEHTITAIRELLDADLMTPGEVKGGFKPWNITSDEVESRIRADWEPLGRRIHLGESALWLCVTDAGKALGAELQPLFDDEDDE